MGGVRLVSLCRFFCRVSSRYLTKSAYVARAHNKQSASETNRVILFRNFYVRLSKPLDTVLSSGYMYSALSIVSF